MNKTPTLFISHGNPMAMLDKEEGFDYGQWSQSLPDVKAILVLSAHWETDQLSFGETKDHSELIYDFYGFPEPLYDVQYPAPGAPTLAEKVRALINKPVADSSRGLDHGVYASMVHMWPDANIPILQMSLPRNFSDRELFEFGQSLAPLREQGILIVGAGTLTHNLRAWKLQSGNEPVDWATSFDDWVENVLVRQQEEELIEWRQSAPNALMNHPTAEHFLPLLIAAGAGWGDEVSFPVTGFNHGIFSRRSVQFG